MMPICRPYSRTARAFRLAYSEFIRMPILGLRLILVYGVQRPFFFVAWSTARLVFPNERHHGGHERARNEHEIVVESADVIEQRVEARDDFPGLDPGDVHLRDSQMTAKLSLAPATVLACLFEFRPHIGGKLTKTNGPDMLLYILLHY